MHFILENIPQTLIKWISRRNAFLDFDLRMCVEVGLENHEENREEWLVGKWKIGGWGIIIIIIIIIPMTRNAINGKSRP